MKVDNDDIALYFYKLGMELEQKEWTIAQTIGNLEVIKHHLIKKVSA